MKEFRTYGGFRRGVGKQGENLLIDELINPTKFNIRLMKLIRSYGLRAGWIAYCSNKFLSNNSGIESLKEAIQIFSECEPEIKFDDDRKEFNRIIIKFKQWLSYAGHYADSGETLLDRKSNWKPFPCDMDMNEKLSLANFLIHMSVNLYADDVENDNLGDHTVGEATAFQMCFKVFSEDYTTWWKRAAKGEERHRSRQMMNRFQQQFLTRSYA